MGWQKKEIHQRNPLLNRGMCKDCSGYKKNGHTQHIYTFRRKKKKNMASMTLLYYNYSGGSGN